MAVQAAGADEELRAARGVAFRPGGELALGGQKEVGSELRGFVVAQAEVRHAAPGKTLRGVLEIRSERRGVPFGADVGERDAVVLVLGGGLGIGPGVAGDAAEIGKERAALREERRVERFGLGRFALCHEICREVRRALVDLAGFAAGEDARHERVRADGVRVSDPRGQPGLAELRPQLPEHRRVLRQLRHPFAFRRDEARAVVAGGAAELREMQPRRAQTLAGEERPGARVVLESGRRHRLPREFLR